MIHIRRSEYEQLLSQKEELKETVRQLRGLLNFEKSLQDIRSVRIRSIIDAAIKNGQDVFFALKSFANVSIKNSALSSYKNKL
ncbi:MAG: hypothetical protein LBG80_16320 [Bacteroidales bacterium]|nr:hypothetical protein [Bacteroidales bacterium]